jgi:putative oxidoreductase
MPTIIQKAERFFENNKSLAPLFIRLFAGFHLIYVTKGPAFDPAKMKGVVDFFSSQEIFAASFLGPLTVYTDLVCGLLFIMGLFTRVAAAAMVFVFICAISIVHIGGGYIDAFPALAMLASALSLLFSGAGTLSLDAIFKRKLR